MDDLDVKTNPLFFPDLGFSVLTKVGTLVRHSVNTEL